MAIQSRNDLKTRFKTGMYPTQEDFYNWLDSFFHKNDKIPADSIKDLDKLLNSSNDTLLKEVQKVVDSYHAVEYAAQDLLKVDITAFKHVLSIHKITEHTTIGFADLSGKIGAVKLIIENTSNADIKLSTQEQNQLILFADTQDIILNKGSFAEIILTGYGDYQSLNYRISRAKEITEIPVNPPDFDKQEEKTMYLETAAQYQIYGCNWDAEVLSFGTGSPNQGTYTYRQIGEYEWMTQNLRMNPVPDRAWSPWVLQQPQIDSYVTKGVYDPMTVEQSLKYEGGFFGAGNYGEVDAFFKETKFYADNTKSVELTGWKQPHQGDFAQLFAMADTLTYEGIIAFLGVEKDNPKYPFKNDWETIAQNTSGFSMIPCGTRNNASGEFRNPRRACAFKTNVDNGSIIRLEPANSQAVSIICDDNSNLNSVYPNASIKFHLVSVRYCRPLTDQELGYKMYLDEKNDQVKVVDVNQTQPTDLVELSKGKLRGRAVRWLNNDKTQVLVPLSTLKEELAITENGGSAGWFDL